MFLLLCLASASVLSSCRGSEEGGRGGAAKASLPREQARVGEVPIRHDFSFTAGVRMEVPRGFPADVAFYPDSVIRMSQKKSPREFVVILGVAEPLSRIESWYREALTGRGWRPSREAELDERRYLRFEKGGHVVTLTLDPEEEETLVAVACILGEKDQ